MCDIAASEVPKMTAVTTPQAFHFLQAQVFTGLSTECHDWCRNVMCVLCSTQVSSFHIEFIRNFSCGRMFKFENILSTNTKSVVLFFFNFLPPFLVCLASLGQLSLVTYVSGPCVLLIRFAGVELRTFAPLCLVCHWLTVSLFDYGLRITVLS